jgi:hypothetical protein
MLRMRPGLVTALAVLIIVAVVASASAAVNEPWSDSANAIAHSSAKKVGSRVKIAGLAGNVTGSVNSKKRQCEKGRLASLIEVAFTGLVEVDREKTTRKGRFGLEGAVPGQTYLVGVGKKTITKFRLGRPVKKTICTQTESDTFVP